MDILGKLKWVGANLCTTHIVYTHIICLRGTFYFAPLCSILVCMRKGDMETGLGDSLCD